MRFRYLMLRAYGDCVISMGLLEGLPAGADVVVVGTGAAQRMAQAIGFTRWPVQAVLPDVAAFFDLKRAGPLRALSDLRAVRAALGTAGPVLFEHRDWRNRWIARAERRREPGLGRSIYEDRRALLAGCFGPLPPLAELPRVAGPVRTLALHPGARLAFKTLPPAVVANVVRFAQARRIGVTLIDPERRHAALAGDVQRYLPAPTLTEAIAAQREADFYVGADSLFLHFAWHFGKPAFAIVPAPAPYFAPPGLLAQRALVTIADAHDPARLGRALDASIS